MPETPYERVIWHCEQCKLKSLQSKKEEAANSVQLIATHPKKKQRKPKKRRNVASLIAGTKKVICQEDITKSAGEYNDCSEWLIAQHIPKKQRTSRKKIAAFVDPKKKEDFKLQNGLKTGTQDSNKHSWITQRCLEGVVSSEGGKDEPHPSKPSCEPKMNSDSSIMEKELAKATCLEHNDETGTNLKSVDFEKGVHENYCRYAQPVIDPIWR